LPRLAQGTQWVRSRISGAFPRSTRLRRLADKQGYQLQKLRGDDGYWLSDATTGGLVIGEGITRGVRVGYDLDAIEEWLR
jgi:hypothetical protein